MTFACISKLNAPWKYKDFLIIIALLTAKCYLSLDIIIQKNVLQLLKTFPN